MQCAIISLAQVRQLNLQNPIPDCQVGNYVTNQTFLIASDKLASIFWPQIIGRGERFGRVHWKRKCNSSSVMLMKSVY